MCRAFLLDTMGLNFQGYLKAIFTFCIMASDLMEVTKLCLMDPTDMMARCIINNELFSLYSISGKCYWTPAVTAPALNWKLQNITKASQFHKQFLEIMDGCFIWLVPAKPKSAALTPICMRRLRKLDHILREFALRRGISGRFGGNLGWSRARSLIWSAQLRYKSWASLVVV